ncbi:hypothetical protein R1sor_017131 [Riccia sorocarpa]|uniref:Mediator of RNA polymerase II transcription subunit 14 n=1 Tax=Riccia sorocarpa TaxID=122646 RepID=A0ABD3IC49_9MARC
MVGRRNLNGQDEKVRMRKQERRDEDRKSAGEVHARVMEESETEGRGQIDAEEEETAEGEEEEEERKGRALCRYIDTIVVPRKAEKDAYSSLKELTGIAPEQSDSERKLSLLKYVLRTRQRLLRLLVLSKWCRQIPLVERCQQLAGTVSNHDTSFTQAADFLFFLHEGLQQARAPVYDIPSAAEVLLTGEYSRLPKCIEELGVQPMLAGEERAEALQKLDTMLRSRLLDISLPKEISDISVSEGRIVLQVDGEFRVQVTAGYRGHLHLWRILHLELLVGESTGLTKLTDHQRLVLGDDLERRMAASDDPFRLLYTVLHDFCTTLVMDTLFRQTGMLRQGRWKDAIRFEKISETSNVSQGVGIGQGTGQGPGPPVESDAELRAGTKSRGSPGLRIWYWLECPKGISGLEPGSSPHLRIEPGPDQHIVCSHQPSVIDPATESEAEFSIVQSCIDVERLLLRAISCNIHTRLLEVQRGLKGSSQLSRVDCDVVLRSSFTEEGDDKASPDESNASGSSGEAGEEVLCVRAYGASFMALGISIRNGRFLLRSPSTLLAHSVLSEMEDALNQGSKDPVDIFLNLRSRSLLHVFASLGANFNLKMYERGALALRFPEDGPKLGPDVLVLGFPNCGEIYFLCLQLDVNFMPFFMLLEAQPRGQTGRPTLQTGPIHIVRWMKISIETMLVTEDDASFSLLDEGRWDADRQSISTAHVPKRAAPGTEMVEFAGKKAEVSLLESRAFGRGISGGPGNDGLQTDLAGEKLYRGSPAAHLTRTNNPLSPSFSPGPSPSSGLQGIVPGNPQYVASNVANQGPNGGFSPGNNSTLANSSLLQSNHRVGRMGNGVMASPARSPLYRGVTSLKSPYQGEPDMLQSKSPLHAGESAASPIDLDDDDISKLIDSISSKTPGVPQGASLSSGDPGSRQSRTGMAARSAPIVKSPGMNPRTPQTKSSSLQSLTSGRVTGQSGNVLARLASPRKPINSQTGSELTSEWMEVDQSSQAVHSPSMHLSPPTNRPSVGGGLITRGTVQYEKATSDSLRRKRAGAELLFSLPSLKGAMANGDKVKRRKIEQETTSQSLVGQSGVEGSLGKTSPLPDSFVGQPYSSMVAAANQGKAPMGSYTAVLLQVVRRCWLCIKHARLTRQMDALGIPHVEEVGLRKPSSNLRFRLPSKDVNRAVRKYDSAGWQQICLCLGKPGSDGWEVEVQDTHFKALWELQMQKTSATWGPGVQFATLPEEDSHFSCTQKGLVMRYSSVEDDSVKKLVADLERLWSARMFAVGIRTLLEEKVESKEWSQDNKAEADAEKEYRNNGKGRSLVGERTEGGEKKWEVMRRAFRVEAVGLTSIWFTYMGSLPGVMARFVVEWEAGNRGCTVHVSPEQLWPHTKYLEDYINGGEVELLLDSIRVTVGPLQALAAAIRPPRMQGPSAATSSGPVQGGTSSAIVSKPANAGLLLGQVSSPVTGSPSSSSALSQGRLPNGSTSVLAVTTAGGNAQVPQTGGLASGPGRPGMVPSSFSTDVSVLLRTPYWIRIVYRRQFAMDMRCFAGDQVWLQPAPPPRVGGSAAGGSLPCPQFRPFVMDHLASGLSNADALSGTAPSANVSGNGGNERREPGSVAPGGWGGGISSTASAMRQNTGSVIGARMGSTALSMASRSGNMAGSAPNSSAMQMAALRNLGSGPNVGLRSEYTAIFGLGDDGGYGGAWVPLAALKKVLRGTLRYLGVLWLFAQFPSILRDVLGSLLKENEGALLNHDPEQPALRFYIGNCVFAVSMHRQQLYLQAINVKKFQQQQQGSEELSPPEMAEISDLFSRRVASEPYDASRLASFVTMLTLPVPVLRDFLKLLAWEKELQRVAATNQSGEGAQNSRTKIELCLENRGGSAGMQEEGQGSSPLAKSSIRHVRTQSIVDFTLTVYLDGQHLPPVNVAGGATWLPQCIAVRLRYQFSEPSRLSVVNVEGSHGGRACWVRQEDWEHNKMVITNAVDHYVPGSDQGSGRLQPIAELIQRTVQQALLSLRRGGLNAPSPMAGPYSS